MVRITESLSAEIAKVKTTFYLVTDEEEIFSQNPNQTLCGYSTFEGSSIRLVRMGHIENQADIEELVAILEHFQQQEGKSLSRIVSEQLQKPESEYSAILWQHLFLQTKDQLQNIAHLDLRSIPVFKNETHLKSPAATNMGTFAKLVNCDGWLRYCDWFNEELEKIPFYLDMLDIYQVEARASDYAHEINSPILIGFRKQVAEIVGQTAKEIVNSNNKEYIKHQISESEKKLFKIRLAIQDNLQNICECFNSLVTYIGTVEKPHPELASIKNGALILNSLIQEDLDLYLPSSMSWIKRILLLSLADCYFEVMPIINCAFEDDRTTVCFAIKQSVIQLVQQGKMQALVKLALEWDKAILSINGCCLKKGILEFEKWLRGSNEQSELHSEALLVHQLRICVYKNLQHFCFPFVETNVDYSQTQFEQLAENVTSDYLDLIPEQFVVYNADSSKAEKLTLEGAKRLLPIFHAGR